MRFRSRSADERLDDGERLRGRTGLLSFGHALFVAAGSYLTAVAMSSLGLPLLPAALVALAGTTLLAVVVGAIALRVGGIAFAMVTLAFAQAAVRENEGRAAVLGLPVYRTKLCALVVASFLGGLGGVVHAMVLGGSSPHITTAEFTLSLLVMVVLGGAGSSWGAVVGGFLYTYADARLVEVSGSSVLGSLPDALEGVLSEPLFILGVFFVLVVYFAPTGITGLGRRLVRRGEP